VLLDCVIYCAFYSILFRGAVFFRSRCTVIVYQDLYMFCWCDVIKIKSFKTTVNKPTVFVAFQESGQAYVKKNISLHMKPAVRTSPSYITASVQTTFWQNKHRYIEDRSVQYDTLCIYWNWAYVHDLKEDSVLLQTIRCHNSLIRAGLNKKAKLFHHRPSNSSL